MTPLEAHGTPPVGSIAEIMGRKLRVVSSQEAEQLRQQLPENNERRSQMFAEATLPALHKSHHGPSLNDSEPWKCVMDKLRSKAKKAFTIALIGNRGCGKTQLGVSLLMSGLNSGLSSKFVSITRLLMEIKATYTKGSSETEIQVMDRYTRFQLLVIDEFSRRTEKDWNDQLLFELLNARYNAQRGTLLISNDTRDGFSSSVGPSIMSRMTETGGVIECNWPSFRTGKQ